MDLETIVQVGGMMLIGAGALSGIALLPSLELHKERKSAFNKGELVRMPTFEESVEDYAKFLLGYCFSLGKKNSENVDINAPYKKL